MRTVTDRPPGLSGGQGGWSRRDALALGLCAVAMPARSRVPQAATLCAAWDDANGRSHVGLLRLNPRLAHAELMAGVPVPTRAHGLLRRRDGSVLAVARRPGDWLLHWRPGEGRHTLHWNDAGRCFNGHLVEQGAQLLTTETDFADGLGRIVLRDARTWRELATWPTFGRDPHDLKLDAPGRLWVANGGIATDAATGRAKDLSAMDSSLVCLDARSGALLGQWRLDDTRLSLRHLALRADGTIGIALQAEHDEPAARAAAPLLALWQDGALRAVEGPALAGYGGDIGVLGDAFLVSAPRAGRVVAWRSDSGWSDAVPLTQACALASAATGAWCSGAGGLYSLASGLRAASAWTLPSGWRMDNHAVA
jgi:hypothetical protein